MSQASGRLQEGNHLPLPPNPARLPARRVSNLKRMLNRLAKRKQKRWQPLNQYTPIPQRHQQNQQQRDAPLDGQRYRPPENQGKAFTTNPREILSMIARFARENKKIIIQYQKATGDRSLVVRAVEPYSIRYKMTKRGRVRYFYGYDGADTNPTEGIHSFILGNIKSVTGTDEAFQPRWVVEF